MKNFIENPTYKDQKDAKHIWLIDYLCGLHVGWFLQGKITSDHLLRSIL